MNHLAKVPKNGSLSNNNSNANFPSLSNWIDDIFNRELPTVFSANFNDGLSMPKVNIKELADAYEVEMAVPGLQKSDFTIDLDNEVLTIATQMQEKEDTETENYTRREFGYAAFRRTFTLPESVNEDKIQANYEAGILKIQLPKKEEAKRKPVRNIKIS